MQLLADKLLENQLARSMGLDKYAPIMEAARSSDVSQNPDFQKAFNAFYRVRRNAKWRSAYYSLFEQAKTKNLSFSDVIHELYKTTGNVEASFTSKMIATIDPNKPIWDQYVLQNLGLELKGKNQNEKLDNAVQIYQEIENWYIKYLSTKEARDNIAVFDQRLPSYAWITDIKKIDYLLWSFRK